MKAILTIFLVSIFSSLTDGDSPDLIERYPALEPYFSIPVETAVPEAGGYLGGQYYKIQIQEPRSSFGGLNSLWTEPGFRLILCNYVCSKIS